MHRNRIQILPENITLSAMDEMPASLQIPAPNSVIYPIPTTFKTLLNSEELTPVLFIKVLKPSNTEVRLFTSIKMITIPPAIDTKTVISGLICFRIMLAMTVVSAMTIILNISILLLYIINKENRPFTVENRSLIKFTIISSTTITPASVVKVAISSLPAYFKT